MHCIHVSSSFGCFSGVGSNLQDHLELYVQQQCTQPITLYKAQKPFTMVKIGLEWLTMFTGNQRHQHTHRHTYDNILLNVLQKYQFLCLLYFNP